MNSALKAAFLALSLVSASQVSANIMNEVGDAGESLATAQSVAGGTSVISGSLSGDADLFSFYWGGGSFYANTTGSTFDSQLFLFDSAGVGIWGNDDGIAFAGPAYIADPALAAGQYFIGVSGFDYDPYSNAGLIFNSYPYESVYGPNNNSPLSTWGGYSYDGGTYFINFQQITSDGTPVGDPTPTGVPEPSTLGIFCLSMLGLALGRRRRAASV